MSSGRKISTNPNTNIISVNSESCLVKNDNKVNSETSNSCQTYNIQDLYKIIQVQQSTINKMTLEVRC